MHRIVGIGLQSFFFLLVVSAQLYATEYKLLSDNFLSVGNQWNYNLQVTEVDGGSVNLQGTQTLSVTGTADIRGYSTHVVSSNIPEVIHETETMNWYQTADHLVEVRWEDADDYEVVQPDFPAGNPWEVLPVQVSDMASNFALGNGNYNGTMKVPPFYTWTGNQTSKITFEGVENVTVPAGTFTCVRVLVTTNWIDDSGWYGNDEMRFWIDHNTGIVKLDGYDITYDQNGAMDESARWSITMTDYSNRMGDVDNDGDVDIADAITCTKTLSGIAANVFITVFSDVNENGKIDTTEAIFVLQKLAGMR